MQDLALVIDFVGLLLFPRNQCYMLTIKVKSFFYLVRGSIISLSLYKNYKLIVYLGHLEIRISYLIIKFPVSFKSLGYIYVGCIADVFLFATSRMP